MSAVSSCPSPFGLKYRSVPGGMLSPGGLLTVTGTAGADQPWLAPKGSVQYADAVSEFAPATHPAVSADPVNVPSPPGAVAPPRYAPLHDTWTWFRLNPPAGVNTQFTVPDTLSPGDGAVSVPGLRVSTPTCTESSAACPEASTACTCTVYTPSGTTLPASSFPSQVA